MANPQSENGHTDIANEILEALCKVNLSSYQNRVLMAVFRKTYGWNKKKDWISNSQIVDLTGLKKQHVSRALSELKKRNMIIREGFDTSFQKDYEQWKELPKKVTVTSTGNSVTSTGNSVTSTGAHKRNYTKETIQKKTFMSDSEEIRLSQLLLDLMKENNPNCRGPSNLQGWAKKVDLMFRREKRTSEQVEYLIRWSQQDDFWMGNILSMGTLRDKFDRLAIQAKKKPIKEDPTTKPVQQDFTTYKEKRKREDQELIRMIQEAEKND